MASTMQRIIKLQSPNGLVDLPVLIFAPSQTPQSWQCAWEIRWPDRVRTNSAGGIDALQALLHAMQMVGIELYTSEEHRSGRLQWIDHGQGYGFPLTRGCRDLLEGEDAEFL